MHLKEVFCIQNIKYNKFRDRSILSAMILNIENLGIVKQAQIDLSKKLILFCGKNGTGKTYASYVLQAFLDERNIIFPLYCIKDIINQLLATGEFRISRSLLVEWLNAKCENVVEDLGSIFGISDTTKEKLFSKFNLSVIYSEEDFGNTLSMPISAQMTEGAYLWKITKEKNSDVVKVDSNHDLSILATNDSIRAAALICNILRNLTMCNISNVRMLTVERNSIYTFKTELSLSRNELIDQIQQTKKSDINIFDFISRSTRRYPQAIRNSLRIANDLENVSKYDSPFAVIAENIEQNLLLGEVSMTKNGDVEFHAQGMPKSRKLPFHLSSSIVKTMASLVIYLRHIAKQGDVLIIDEPEMNFHPDVQVLLARLFAKLANTGLHVVMSTHSDYIVRELNNLIMAHAIKDGGIDNNVIADLGYQDSMLLDCNDVCALLFDKTGKTVVRVTPMHIDKEGLAISSIDSTINNQNIAAERLYTQLQDLD